MTINENARYFMTRIVALQRSKFNSHEVSSAPRAAVVARGGIRRDRKSPNLPLFHLMP